MKERPISRREFLKASLPFLGATFLPGRIYGEPASGYPPEDEGEPARISEIMSMYTPLAFDREGNLLRETPDNNGQRMSFVPTRYSRDSSNSSNLVKDVKLLVVHFDGADRGSIRGRTALGSINGLDGNYASTHWCVDEYPINPQGNEDSGYGIIQSQYASGDVLKPYQGAHVLIGINLHTKAPDVTRLNTLKLFEELGIDSKLKELIDEGITDFDRYSLGFEQVGARFSVSFPLNFPPERQIANALSLSLAVMKHNNLSPWDVVGHKEIQEKDDPGAEFMATLRLLMAVGAEKGLISKNLIYQGRGKNRYFETIKNYLTQLRGEAAFARWSGFLGFEDYLKGVEEFRWSRVK